MKQICVETFSKIYLRKSFLDKLLCKKIKEFSYLLISINYPINIFLKNTLTILLDDHTLIHKRKIKLIYFVSESEYKYNKSYNKMVHIEYILLNIYRIIKT